MRGRRNLGQLLFAGLVFGVAMAIVKGQDTGVRDALGNTSAPWVVVPFLAGARYTTLRAAALVGVAATLVAFFGFYLAEAAVLDLGAHPWYDDVRLTLSSGNVYETWGIVSGALYGALGGLWGSRRLAAAPVAVALAFICEPVIVLLLVRAGVWGGGGLLQYDWLWLAEIAVGIGCLVPLARARAGVNRA